MGEVDQFEEDPAESVMSHSEVHEVHVVRHQVSDRNGGQQEERVNQPSVEAVFAPPGVDVLPKIPGIRM